MLRWKTYVAAAKRKRRFSFLLGHEPHRLMTSQYHWTRWLSQNGAALKEIFPISIDSTSSQRLSPFLSNLPHYRLFPTEKCVCNPAHIVAKAPLLRGSLKSFVENNSHPCSSQAPHDTTSAVSSVAEIARYK